jgi:hypothetical protein
MDAEPSDPSSRDSTELTPCVNPLAEVVVALARQLRQARCEIHWHRLVAASGGDFCNWLEAQLCRARGWTIVDLLSAWHQELDRRSQSSKQPRSDGRVA